ncbi:MAG TPA: YncE family protein [Bryobacteraceae bacterium]|nr:YncE family protein [Bryobacteraceae bacterium]
MISRRAFLALPLAAACSRPAGGYRGYAFVANADGPAIAAVDLEALAVARHIPLDASPEQVIASQSRPSVFALTPSSGSIHEIESDHLRFRRKAQFASKAVSMSLSQDERSLWLLARDPRALIRVSPDSLSLAARIPLPADPLEFDLTPDGKTAAVSFGSSIQIVDLQSQKLGAPIEIPGANFGAVRFRGDGRSLIAADRANQRLSIYDAATAQLISHLPLAVRPDNLCFNADGGQLFITGPGFDGVVIVFPYHIPEVAETILAGNSPGPMGASGAFLFVTSPPTGVVSILEIRNRKVIGVVPVGSDPACVVVTNDDQYALVLNRTSGDMAVLRISSIQPNPIKKAALLTVIPVGSRPVSAAVRAV